MSYTWTICDVSNLSWRAFHSTGGLSYQGSPTGVVFGVLGTILQLEEEFGPCAFVFCFDSPTSKRKEVCKDYKQNRIPKVQLTDEQQQRLLGVYTQIQDLKTKHLPNIGFQNIFQQDDYEADDLIAYICKNLPKKDRAVIVSSDQDLFQLISPRIKMYDPRKKFLWTVGRFRKKYKLRDPKIWATVKAIAGCKSDSIKGVPGVGEKTAIQFLRLELLDSSKKYQKILSPEGLKIRKRNLPLVRLPYPGVQPMELKRDKKLDWSETLRSLGIKSFGGDLVYRERPR
jgi:DNA polymerase-1